MGCDPDILELLSLDLALNALFLVDACAQDTGEGNAYVYVHTFVSLNNGALREPGLARGAERLGDLNP